MLAPLGLGILGQEYSTNGTALLRLLLLSAIPQVVIGIALGAARVRRDNRLILAVYAAQALGVFGGTFLTIDRWGLTGVGLSWLVTQTTVALALILTRRTGTESGGIEFSGAVDWAGRVVSRLRRRAEPPAGARACGSGTERMRIGITACGVPSARLRQRLTDSGPRRATRAIGAQDRHDHRSLTRA